MGLTARYHPHGAYAVGLSYQRSFSHYAQRQTDNFFSTRIRRSLVTFTHDYYTGKSRVRPLVGWAIGVTNTRLDFERNEAGADTAGRSGYGSFVGMIPKLGVLLRPSDRLSMEVTSSSQRLFTPGNEQLLSESGVRGLEGRPFFPAKYLVFVQATLRWTVQVKY